MGVTAPAGPGPQGQPPSVGREVTSAISLDDKIVQDIGDQVGEQTGRKVELSSRVDPEILGGIVLRVGNVILDASILNRLEQLRKQVAQA